METKSLELIKILEKSFKEQHRLRMLRAASQCAAVISSQLFTKCLEVQRTLNGSDPVNELEMLLSNHAIPRPLCGLPPLSTKLLLARLKQIHPQIKEQCIYTVQLPENHPSWEGRRAGLILRQHMVHGQIKSLFVAGTEKGSPANRSLNLRCGDRLLAISGFPLDWRTLELHYFGLLDAEHLKGLRPNANMHDLACHLLDEPYRQECSRLRTNQLISKPLLVLASQKTDTICDEKKHESIMNSISKKSIGSRTSTLDEDQTDLDYQETVLDTTNEECGLGLQLGINEATSGVYIVSISQNSQAALDGILREGDRIVEVNYQDIKSLDSREALKKIKSLCHKKSFVQIKVARPIQDANNSPRLINHTKNPEFKENKSCSEDTTASQLSADQKQSKNLIGGTSSSVETKIMQGISATDQSYFNDEPQIAISSREELGQKYAYQLDYWKNQFPPEVKILVTEYDISQSTCGLGISIEGTMEQEFGESEPQSHHYIVDLAPQGPLQIQGVLMPEDELLEVNEQILYGEEHLKVARILHSIDPQGYIICARYKKANQMNSLAESPDHTQPETPLCPNTSTAQISKPELENLFLQSTDSEDTSDVDRNSNPPRVIIARSSRFVPATEEITEAIDVTHNVDEIEDKPRSEQYSITREISDGKHSSARTLDVTAENSNFNFQIVVARKLPEVDSCSRLPMPAKLAKLNEDIPRYKERKQSPSTVCSLTKIEQTEIHDSAEVVFRPEENCLSVTFAKQSGEFVGLEIDSEDGGPNGILLLGIISGSPVDRLSLSIRQPLSWGSRTSLSHYSSQSDMLSNFPLLQPGDWIVSVAGYTFRNRENFKARRLLRRLVVSSGTFEIKYIPSNWTVVTHTEAVASESSSVDSELNHIRQAEFSEPERSDG